MSTQQRHYEARWRDGATAIVGAALQQGLANCAVSSFYDSQDGGNIVSQMARDGNFPRGAVMTDVAGMAASEALTLVAMVITMATLILSLYGPRSNWKRRPKKLKRNFIAPFWPLICSETSQVVTHLV